MKVFLCNLPLVILFLLEMPRCVAADTIEFNRDIRPILSINCISCHGPDAQHREADLRLDVRETAVTSGAILPGQPDRSVLIERITSTDPDIQMPPASSGRMLTDEQKELLKRWISEGAEYQKHWSFEPPRRVTPPEVAGVDHPIDRFLQARLAESGLQASPLASSETLIRRVSLDLTGLPPSIEEIDHFIAAAERDPEQAWNDLVTRLLDSPHYGERWGRWWLDQARYADSNGYSIDGPRQIWAWRDWVIRALNDDLPFDQFTIEQLAGDLLPDATESQRVATGFHRNTQINQEGGIDKEQFRVDSVFDRVATTGTVWLGLTIGCAQCHDHKFDPISQKEYYQLFAFLNNQDEPSIRVYNPDNGDELRQSLKASEAEQQEYLKPHQQALADWENSLSADAQKQLSPAVRTALSASKEKRTAAQWRQLYLAGPGSDDSRFVKLHQRMQLLEEKLEKAPATLVMQERSTPRETHILIKGDFTRPSDRVTPGTPSLLHPFGTDREQPNRLDFARWLTSPDNPLTSRVIVNRVWQQYFGRGIVETESDFGMQGTLPSHPELLDFLALEFIASDWRLKDLHRLIVTSHAYRQSSRVREDLQQKDPQNYLLGRQNRLRLEAELIRDVSLAASGLLSSRMGGPPVYPPIPDGVMGQGQVKHAWKVSEGEDRYRRGLYTFVFRATPPPALNVFDAPDGYSTCTRRIRSNTPLQALTLLNDSTSVEFAKALEKIIQAEGLEAAFRRCTSRRPQSDELAILQSLDVSSAARVLLNLDETITRE